MKKRLIVLFALIGLAIFFKFRKMDNRVIVEPNEEVLQKNKKSKQLKLDKISEQKTLSQQVVPSEVSTTESTSLSRDRTKPQTQENIIRFEATDENDPGYIELMPVCDGCKPATAMTLVNSINGVRVKTHQPNSSTLKDLVPGARRTFGFQGACGFTSHVILIFNYDADASGKAQFTKSIFKIQGRGIQTEVFDLSSEDFIGELKKTFSLEDCKTIQTPW